MGCKKLTYYQNLPELKAVRTAKELTSINTSQRTRRAYVYGFQNMERDDEIKGSGNSYTTTFRQYDPRLGKWLSTDPVTHAQFSPYSAFDNNPIYWIDPLGANAGDYYDKEGNFLGSDGIDDGKVYHVEGTSKFNIGDYQEGGKYFNNQSGFSKDNGSGFSISQWNYNVQDSKLEEYMPTLLGHEGGFVNNPNDPGGATNKGITLNTFKKYSEDLLGVKPTLGNLKRLTDNQASAIYETGYWNPSGAGRISDKQMGWLHFDTYLHGGASSVLRSTLSIYDRGSGIGNLNTQLRTTNASEIFEQYKCERICRFDRIIENNSNLSVFRQGWINRVNRFQYQSTTP